MADPGDTFENLDSADFVLENLRTLDNCQGLRKRAGKNMVNDSVGDALIRIKNGYMAMKLEVYIPYSKLVGSICELLVKEGYIKSAKIDKTDILVELKYIDRKPALVEVKRISKPGLRVYMGAKKLPKVLNGYGIAIVSTPKGIMTGKEARKLKSGGEVMAFVW